MTRIFGIIMLLHSLPANAQKDSITPPLAISGYLETYYSYDVGNPSSHNRPGFIYSHNRHNEFNLNLGLLKAAYTGITTRANLSLAAGTYMNANLAEEPGVLKNIYEANAGIKLSKKNNIWLDAGVFASHLGFESAIGKDCWTLTRSLMAENSPYYESGAKISFLSPGEKWLLSGLIVNGWQRIQRVNGNNTPAFGHQLTYQPNSTITLNSSSFIGNDKPDSTRRMRYFHDFYAIITFNQLLAITAGFDIGTEQQSKGSKNYDHWLAPLLIIKISPNANHNLAARVEYYNDKNGVIISTGAPNGFKTWGYSLNYDVTIGERFTWRIEGRGFRAKDAIFEKNGIPSRNNFLLTSSLAVVLK